MKTTPKTLRPDYRYLKIKIDADESKNSSAAVNLIENNIKTFCGQKGLAKMDLVVLGESFCFKEQEVTVRLRKKFEDLFRASMVISNIPVYVFDASGT